MSESGRHDTGQKDVSVFWYGERGVVNSLVIAIQAGGVSAVSALLRQVQWADNSQPAWLTGIASVSMIVEPGCSEFGDPDLILVLTANDAQRYVVYFEAKVVTYAASAVPNSKGMEEKKFNSSINGQLSLRYRMSLALAQWNGTAGLVEPATIYKQYRRSSKEGGINEKLAKPRHLLKKSVLKLLREAGIHGVPAKHFHFLAVTSDHELDLSTSMPREIRPLFLDDEGKDCWEQISPRVGWLGFSKIELTSLNELLSASYRQALGTMLESEPRTTIPAPTTKSPRDPSMTTINSYNIKTNSLESTINQLTAVEAAARNVTELWKVTRGETSTSVIFSSKTIAKIVPQKCGKDEYLLLGISSIYDRFQWNGHKLEGPKIFKQQPFYWIDLPRDATGADKAEGILAELAAVSGAEPDIE